MAREIRDINQKMLEEKAGTASLAGLTSNSSASIWRTLFYIVATAIHTLEKIFDLHRQEVTETIENIIPHRPKWYRDMALKFMAGKTLIDETDRYDTSGMTEEEIEAARIVKYATAVENDQLLIKIATGEPGNLKPVPDEVLYNENDPKTTFEYYMNEIRDAGVHITVVNEEGDQFGCSLIIYYDPVKLVEGNYGVRTAIENAIKNYITGLPFNGEYSNMALVDAVQLVDGVRVVTFQQATIGENHEPINGKVVPKAGYFKFDENTTINLRFIPYEAGQQL